MAHSDCRGCGEQFVGLGAFDAHQETTDEGPRFTVCADPAEVGLSQRPDGRWGPPPTEDTEDTVPSAQTGEGVGL